MELTAKKISLKKREGKVPCAYCGNNPVPHFLNWYFESLNVLLAPVRRILLQNFFSVIIQKLINKLFPLPTLVEFSMRLKIVSLQPDRKKCKVARAAVLWEEAERRGIVLAELLLFGKPFDTYVAKKNGRKLVFTGLPRPRDYDNSTLDILDDKAEFKKIMQSASLPVPAGRSVWNFSQARKVFQEVQKPVIVKPRAGSRGRHSTTFIYTEEDLKQAFFRAKQLCFWVIVEEHIPGPVYRGTVIDYKIRGVLRGDSPQVVGDGVHSIGQLVELKNSRTHEGVQDIIISYENQDFLKRQLGIQSSPVNFVPQDGQVVYLSEKIGVSYGGSSSEDFDKCHPDNKALFEAAAKACRDPILGFDFIIEDITASWKSQRSGFIEANTLPFINLHHDPLLGRPQNVAQYVWQQFGW